MHGDVEKRVSGHRCTSGSAVIVTALAALLTAAAVSAQTAPTYDPRAAFREADSNQDGAVDHSEFDARMAEVFFHADGNKDGSLSKQECSVTLIETDNVTDGDSNRDGKTTLHEFTRASVADYEQADTNDNGLLEVDEVVGAYQAPKK